MKVSIRRKVFEANWQAHEHLLAWADISRQGGEDYDTTQHAEINDKIQRSNARGPSPVERKHERMTLDQHRAAKVRSWIKTRQPCSQYVIRCFYEQGMDDDEIANSRIAMAINAYRGEDHDGRAHRHLEGWQFVGRYVWAKGMVKNIDPGRASKHERDLLRLHDEIRKEVYEYQQERTWKLIRLSLESLQGLLDGEKRSRATEREQYRAALAVVR